MYRGHNLSHGLSKLVPVRIDVASVIEIKSSLCAVAVSINVKSSDLADVCIDRGCSREVKSSTVM